jgi:hypothetical protein
MENTPNIQLAFFKQIRDNLPPHLSLVDEIAELLEVSNDSAYRRIRGGKPLSFDELSILSSHFKISLDQFLHLKSDSVIFSGLQDTSAENFFEQYLTNLLGNISQLNSFKKKHLYFLTKDLPWISYFQVPELASFKFFVWMKSVLFIPSMKQKKFSLKTDYSHYLDLGRKIVRIYHQIPGTEIWNLEGLHTTLQQIDFYRESDLFESEEDLRIIFEKLELLVNHTEKQAELGKKFAIGEKPGPDSAEFNMFYNELALGDNTVLAELDGMKITYLNHGVIHFISTRDKRFNEQTHDSMMNLIRKSAQISSVGERERIRFFNILRSKIEGTRNPRPRISHDS